MPKPYVEVSIPAQRYVTDNPKMTVSVFNTLVEGHTSNYYHHWALSADAQHGLLDEPHPNYNHINESVYLDRT